MPEISASGALFGAANPLAWRVQASCRASEISLSQWLLVALVGTFFASRLVIRLSLSERCDFLFEVSLQECGCLGFAERVGHCDETGVGGDLVVLCANGSAGHEYVACWAVGFCLCDESGRVLSSVL